MGIKTYEGHQYQTSVQAQGTPKISIAENKNKPQISSRRSHLL